jgi:hypothetical protein
MTAQQYVLWCVRVAAVLGTVALLLGCVVPPEWYRELDLSEKKTFHDIFSGK